jgi:excisionase family DNA binding protein
MNISQQPIMTVSHRVVTAAKQGGDRDADAIRACKGRPMMLRTGAAAGQGAIEMSVREEHGQHNGRTRSHARREEEWPERLLRTSEVAELFSVSSRTVREWARRGLLPTIRTPGGQHRFPERPVRELLHRVRGPADQQDWPGQDEV